MAVHEWLQLQEPTSNTMEHLNFCQDGTNVLIYLEIMLKNNKQQLTMQEPLIFMAKGNLLVEHPY
jgi:hypothetical protein